RAHEADRARAGDQYPARRPARATADALDVLPGLGEHARRLEQHRRHTQRRAHVDEKFRRAAKALDREAVRLLDAALGVLPVAAHIPLAERAVDARQRIGLSDDPDHHVSDGEAAVWRRFDYAS